MMMTQYKAALAIRKFQSIVFYNTHTHTHTHTHAHTHKHTHTHTHIHKHTQKHSVPPDHPFKRGVKCYQHDKLQKVRNVSLTITVSPPG